MNKITFDNVLPKVFDSAAGELWQHVLSLERGQIYLIEADSGRGKSTFCSYLIGQRRDYVGNIFFDGRDSRSYRVREWIDLRREHISLLFQDLRLFPELSARENVEIKNLLTHYCRSRQIDEWFERLGIARKKETAVGHLSFGERQRVAFIRALAQPFEFLVADEPISHLDDDNARVMGDIINEEAARRGAGVIITSIGKHITMNYNRRISL